MHFSLKNVHLFDYAVENIADPKGRGLLYCFLRCTLLTGRAASNLIHRDCAGILAGTACGTVPALAAGRNVNGLALLGGGLFLFGRQFLALFTTESAVIDAGMKRVGVMALAYCISAFMDCTIAASRGLGKTVVPTIIVVMGSCVFRVIWVYTVFAYFHTIPSLYLLYVFSWSITAVAEILYFIRIYKQKMALLS